ncbi:MAG: hypothetical protein R2731_05805 [Nocardioides sp.]
MDASSKLRKAIRTEIGREAASRMPFIPISNKRVRTPDRRVWLGGLRAEMLARVDENGFEAMFLSMLPRVTSTQPSPSTRRDVDQRSTMVKDPAPAETVGVVTGQPIFEKLMREFQVAHAPPLAREASDVPARRQPQREAAAAVPRGPRHTETPVVVMEATNPGLASVITVAPTPLPLDTYATISEPRVTTRDGVVLSETRFEASDRSATIQINTADQVNIIQTVERRGSVVWKSVLGGAARVVGILKTLFGMG